MMRILGEIAITLSESAAVFLIVKGTVAVALGLMTAWLARRRLRRRSLSAVSS